MSLSTLCGRARVQAAALSTTPSRTLQPGEGTRQDTSPRANYSIIWAGNIAALEYSISRLANRGMVTIPIHVVYVELFRGPGAHYVVAASI